jgi:PAS domain S-box-containing protein
MTDVEPAEPIITRETSEEGYQAPVAVLLSLSMGAQLKPKKAHIMSESTMFKHLRKLVELIRSVKWDVVALLLFVPLASESINRYLGTEPFLRRFGSFREPLIEMVLLTGIGVFISIRGAERLRIIERLRAAEARYRGVVEDQTELICRFLPDWTLTFVNEAYCSYFGKSRDELLGRSFMSFIPEEERGKVAELLFSLSQGAPCSTVEHRVFAGGRQCWQQWTNRAIFDTAGNVAEFQAVGRDVTERKLAESEREGLIEALKGKNADLEMLNQTISHDLKSPLITVRGLLTWVERDVEGGNTERLKSNIRLISSAAARMEELTNQLSQFMRIGQLSEEMDEFQFSNLALEATELVSGRIAQRGVEVIVAPDLPTIRGNRSLLLQVLQNLIENSIKFMGDQPYPKIEIGARFDQSEPVYFVQDNGVGIDPSFREKVFGVFKRVGDKSVEGSGLGLALVKRAVEVQGGRIWVESEGRGRGSTFFFSLPRLVSDMRAG